MDPELLHDATVQIRRASVEKATQWVYIRNDYIFLVINGFIYQILIRISKMLIFSYYNKIRGTDPFNLDNLPSDLPESKILTSSLNDRKYFMVFDSDAKTMNLNNSANTHISNDKDFLLEK